MHHDARVDEYIAGLAPWQQTICREVREIVHSADPEIQETIKRNVQPYFTCAGRNVIALLGAEQWVCVFTYCGGIVPDPEGLITRGHENESGRQINVREGDPINASAMRAYFAQICADNRAGGWRKLKAQS